MSEIIRPKTTARPTRSWYDLGCQIIVKPYSSMVRVSVCDMDTGACVILQSGYDQWQYEYISDVDMYESLPIPGHVMLMDCGDGTKTGTDTELQKIADAKSARIGMMMNTARYHLAQEMDLTVCE